MARLGSAFFALEYFALHFDCPSAHWRFDLSPASPALKGFHFPKKGFVEILSSLFELVLNISCFSLKFMKTATEGVF